MEKKEPYVQRGRCRDKCPDPRPYTLCVRLHSYSKFPSLKQTSETMDLRNFEIVRFVQGKKK